MATLPNPNIISSTVQAASTVAGVSTLLGGVVGGSVGQALTNLGAASSLVAAGGKVVSGLLDPSSTRLGVAGLTEGGGTTASAQTSSPTVSVEDDWRVRISVGPNSKIFYLNDNPGILTPLLNTKGVIFPYTPQIQMNYQNTYANVPVTHSINSVQSYQNSDVSSISITATFTAQTAFEAQYVLAAVHFFKSASKMFFGGSDATAEASARVGSPPPILFLNGLGQHYFPNVPVILTGFTHSIPDDVDFIAAYEQNLTKQITQIPTVSTMALTLIPQYSRTTLRKFNLDDFARGNLIKEKGRFV